MERRGSRAGAQTSGAGPHVPGHGAAPALQAAVSQVHRQEWRNPPALAPPGPGQEDREAVQARLALARPTGDFHGCEAPRNSCHPPLAQGSPSAIAFRAHSASDSTANGLFLMRHSALPRLIGEVRRERATPVGCGRSRCHQSFAWEGRIAAVLVVHLSRRGLFPEDPARKGGWRQRLVDAVDEERCVYRP